MSIQTFGIPGQTAPDADQAREMLDANDRKLLNIVQAMVDAVRNPLSDNAVKLGKVDQRLRSSINGHLRRNTALIKPVAQALQQGVQTALDQNQAVVNVVSATPEVQSAMLEVPPIPAYDGSIPQLAPNADSGFLPGLPPPAPFVGGSPTPGAGFGPAAPGAGQPLDAQGPFICPHFEIPPGWIRLQAAGVWPPNGPWQSWTVIFETGQHLLLVDFTNRQPKPLDCAVSIGKLSQGEILQWIGHYAVFVYPLSPPQPIPPGPPQQPPQPIWPPLPPPPQQSPPSPPWPTSPPQPTGGPPAPTSPPVCPPGASGGTLNPPPPGDWPHAPPLPGDPMSFVGCNGAYVLMWSCAEQKVALMLNLRVMLYNQLVAGDWNSNNPPFWQVFASAAEAQAFLQLNLPTVKSWCGLA